MSRNTRQKDRDYYKEYQQRPIYKKYMKDYRLKNRKRLNLFQVEWREKHAALGLCHRCNMPKMAGLSVCEKHWFMTVANDRLGKGGGKHWSELRDILKRQDYKCFYTGQILTPGVDCQLDHIKPVSRFPELIGNVGNIQWVSKNANIAKNNLTHDEFINFCKTIAGRF